MAGPRAYNAHQVALANNPAYDVSANIWNADYTLVNVPGTDIANTFDLAQTFTLAPVLGAGVVSSAGVALPVTATAPVQISTAQAGVAASVTASAAVAGSSVAGAAAGGSVTVTAGNAARNTSGNANGGDITLMGGTGIGTGTAGAVKVSNDGVATAPAFQIGTGDRAGFRYTNSGLVMCYGGADTLGLNNGGAGITVLNGRRFGWNATINGTMDAALERDAASITKSTDGAGNLRDHKVRNLLVPAANGSYVQTPSMTVANLAAAGTAGAGARAFVTDATATTFLSTVAGGGANKVPVVSDGTNWLIG